VTQVIVPDTLRVASLLAHTLYDFPSHQLTTIGVLLMVNHNDFCTLINNILTKFMAINCIAF
jgi:UDP-N-acetylmuramoyl-L-alanyl-D-glutamate-L-lysine ligase